MHILITNDDGPPSPQSSPYIRCLVDQLEDFGHDVSVCLPHTQRSWIGKAHMIGQTLKPSYYRPSDSIHGVEAEGTTHSRPSISSDVEEWVLIDGTPASCVQIGLHHFFQHKGPFDLVVSGPNYGRNTTAVFALSSGTLGGALEASICKQKAIALSFAFFSRNHDPDIIEEACRHSVKVIEALFKQWPMDGSVDVYSVNVPLIEGVSRNKTLWTNMLQNYWGDGSCFQEIEGESFDEGAEEERIREGEVDAGEITNGIIRGHTHKHFKWAPRFTDVYQSVEESEPGNDGWTVKEGYTSVTPLKANFEQAAAAYSRAEFELPIRPEASETLGRKMSVQRNGQVTKSTPLKAIIAYEDPYVQPLILSALASLLSPGAVNVVTDLPLSQDGSIVLPSADEKVLQIIPYEAIDFEFAAAHAGSCLINSYMIRKALIRKHYLSLTVDHWIAKNPASILKKHVKRTETFEVDYAEFLDDAVIEAFDLRESMDHNVALSENADTDPSEVQWWILKPGMSDRGQGIRLFSTMEELQEIFDQWEEERPDSDDEDDGETQQEETTKNQESDGDYITTSHLRHFVAQPYIHPPLLLEGDGRKFHIRTYILCSGALNVYVYRHMLALFAAKPYVPPWESTDDIETFLTNTCLQESPGENTVRRFWDLSLPQSKLTDIYDQVCSITGEVFEAAARAMAIHFQTMPNAFEVFGLDFLVDAEGVAWLLEVNAFPDFKQTGGDLQEIVEGFWAGVLRNTVPRFFALDAGLVRQSERFPDGDLKLVKSVDLGRR